MNDGGRARMLLLSAFEYRRELTLRHLLCFGSQTELSR